MTPEQIVAEEVTEQALELTYVERAQLAIRMIESLEGSAPEGEPLQAGRRRCKKALPPPSAKLRSVATKKRPAKRLPRTR